MSRGKLDGLTSSTWQAAGSGVSRSWRVAGSGPARWASAVISSAEIPFWKVPLDSLDQ
jgi:hypothetical protein